MVPKTLDAKKMVQDLLAYLKQVASDQTTVLASAAQLPKIKKTVHKEEGGGIFSSLSTIPKKKKEGMFFIVILIQVDGRRAVQTIDLDESVKRSKLVKNAHSSKPLSADDIKKKKEVVRVPPPSPLSPSTPNKRKAESQPTSAQPSDAKRARTDTATKPKKRVRFPDNDEQMLKIKIIPNREELAEMMKEEQKSDDMDWNAQSPQPNRYASQQNESPMMNERAAEKQMFDRKREEKRRKLQEMSPTCEFKLVEMILPEEIPRAQVVFTEEYHSRKAYQNTHPEVVYRSKDQIPADPASPTREGASGGDFLQQLMGSVNSVLSNIPVPTQSTPYNQYSQPAMGYQPPSYQSSYSSQPAFGAVPPTNRQPPSYSSPPDLYRQPNAPSGPYGALPPSFGALPPQTSYAPSMPSTNGFGAIRPGDPGFVNGPSMNRYDQGANLAGVGSMKPHTSRIAQSGKNIRCKFFTSEIGCRNGANCQFWHQGDTVPPGGVVEFDPEIARMLKNQQHNDGRSNQNQRHRDDHHRR